MKEAMWGYLILLFGVVIIVFMLIVQNLTSTTEEDFYLSREVLEASMYDAIDFGTYAKSGKLVMCESKFVEVFLRRFAESVTDNKDYTINFYDIHEYPPKATVTITTATGSQKIIGEDVNLNAITYLNAIIETNYNRVEKDATLRNNSIMFRTDSNGKILDDTNSSSAQKVTLTYKFLSDNDSCGYYIDTTTDNGRKMTKNPSNEADKYYEYCYIKDNSSDNYYYVRIEDLENIKVKEN